MTAVVNDLQPVKEEIEHVSTIEDILDIIMRLTVNMLHCSQRNWP